MSCQKRKANKEESEKTTQSPAKRGCFFEEPSSPKKKNLTVGAEKSSRLYTNEERKRIEEILEAEFDNELQAKENEIIEIQEQIIKTQRILQYLCYAVVSDFYSREKTITSVASTRQRRIHPAVKRLLSGKGPPGAPEQPRNVTIPADSSLTSSSSSLIDSRSYSPIDNDILARVDSPKSVEGNSEKEKKVPRYIPPKPKARTNTGSQSEPTRGGQNKAKTILVVGNVSKWFPPDTREDAASHKWMVYVRGPKEAPDISSFVSKVRFFLHPSYRPNDVVQVVCPPFQLSRRGWGEFPIRVQVHFSNSLNKPVDIIHNLKLDRTYSGLQTLGAETVAEVWLHREKLQSEIPPEQKLNEEPHRVKEEPGENSDDVSPAMQIEETDQNVITTFQNLGSPSKKLSESFAQNIGKNIKSTTESQSVKPLESDSLHLTTRTSPHSPAVKVKVSSTLSLQKNLQDSSLFIDPVISKIKKEPLSENELLMMPDFSAPKPASTSTTSNVGKAVIPSSSIVFSPSKVMPFGNLMTPSLSAVQKLQLSPTKQGDLNPEGLTQVPQKIQVSPSKPGTQLVKCIDSKGNVRLLQVRTDLLPKLLKGSTTTATAPAPAPTSPAKASPVRMLVSSSSTSNVSATCSLQPQTLVNSGATKLPLTTPPKALGLQAGTTVSPRALVPGVRQVLRLVRPVGDTNARPMLVARSSVVQPGVRVPVQPTGNGNRPLLVLKDGKLFMMKSSIPTPGVTAAVSTSKPKSVSNSILHASSLIQNSTVESKPSVVVHSHESMQIVSSVVSKTTVARSIDPSVTTKLTSVMASPLSTSSLSTASSNLGKAVDVNTNENVCATVSNNSHTVSLNPGNVQSLSSVSIPPVMRLPAPKLIIGNDQVVQPIDKSNIVFTQRLATPQGILGTSAPKIAVKPGKSLLKSSVSLLKSNVGVMPMANRISTIPSATAHSSSLVSLPPPLVPPLTTPAILGVTAPTTTTVKRIILGRTSGSSTITATSQRALVYRELLGSVIRSCPKDLEDVWRALRWIIKHLPLINSEAKHPEFRILHPYSAPDEKTFCSWNIGKQRACEWLRAKTARFLLKEVGWNLQNVWSTREIVLWARFHGYTPGLPEEDTTQPRNMSCGGECENPIETISGNEKIAFVEEWLASQAGLSSDPSYHSHGLKLDVQSDESDEEVDVVSSNISPSKVKVKQEPCSSSLKYVCDEMPLDPSLHGIGDMVTNSLKRCGLRLSSEEIVPGVLYPAAHRVLIQAVHSLVEDLTRRALADAWGKNVSRRPGSIEALNVCGAICHRPELDTFTCAGLGVAPASFLPASKTLGTSKSQSSSKSSKSSNSSSAKNIKRT